MPLEKIPSVLNYTTGFPLMLGLQHFESLKKVRVASPGDKVSVTKTNGEKITNFGVTDGYHHYFIATRPRCMFVTDSFSWDKKKGVGAGHIEFETGYKKYLKIPFRIFLNGKSPYPFPAQGEDFKSHKDIECCRVESSEEGYPNRLLFTSNSGNMYGFFLEPDLLHFIDFENDLSNEDLNFRIEYIGISTGKNGNRDFADRLWNHEKVREISGYIQRDYPNRQVYIFGYQSQYSIEPVPGGFITNSLIIETNCGMRAWAEVLEASLIKYFQPTYNDQFKGFLDTENPAWLGKIRQILLPEWDLDRPRVISASFFSDNSLNPSGNWFFGGFYTDFQKSIKISETINLTI